MSTHTNQVPEPPKSTAQPDFFDKHHFLLRRLHSLSGIVPVGIFVIFHLFTNFQMAPALLGMESTFQHEVEFIHDLPALLFVEIGLWLGIGFHAALGMVYWLSGRENYYSGSYKYRGGLRYTWQRWTGVVALVFIFCHVATLRWGWPLFGFTPFYVHGYTADGTEVALSHASTAMALQHPLVLALYVVGVYAAIYHWANGLWTAAITWGLTLSHKAQNRWGAVCAAMGIVLAIFAAGSIAGAVVYELSPEEQEAYQLALEEKRAEYGFEPASDAGEGETDAQPETSDEPAHDEAAHDGAPISQAETANEPHDHSGHDHEH